MFPDSKVECGCPLSGVRLDVQGRAGAVDLADHDLYLLGARAYGNGCLHVRNISGFGRKFFQCSDQIHSIHISHVTSTFASNVIANNISFTFEM